VTAAAARADLPADTPSISAPRLSRVVVLGGSGFVGRALCRRLAAASPATTVVLPTRRLGHAQALAVLPGVQLRLADVHDPAALASLLEGADAVVNLVAILHGRPADFERVHVALPRTLAAACRAAGTGQLLHVSALGVGPLACSNYLRSKTAGEALVADAAPSVSVLRPSVIFGAEDRFIRLLAALQALAPVLPLAGSDARFQPVWVEDVADAVWRLLRRRAPGVHRVEAAGPQVFTLSALARLAGQWSGHARPQIALPAGLARLQALLMEHLPGPALMSRDNIDSMQQPNVASGAEPGLDSLGLAATPIEAVMPAVLSAHEGPARLDAWRARRD
jgi:uncharacterized protein YbjT (DUF2867 family)